MTCQTNPSCRDRNTVPSFCHGDEQYITQFPLARGCETTTVVSPSLIPFHSALTLNLLSNDTVIENRIGCIFAIFLLLEMCSKRNPVWFNQIARRIFFTGRWTDSYHVQSRRSTQGREREKQPIRSIDSNPTLCPPTCWMWHPDEI